MLDDDEDKEDPGEPSPDRPLTIGAAVWWFFLATVGMLLLLRLTMSMRGDDAAFDIVNAVGCQAAGYLLSMLLLVRVHASQRPLHDALGLRPTHFGFYLLALALGLSLQFTADVLQGFIELRWPTPPEQIQHQMQMLKMDSVVRRVTVPVVVIGLGPFVEELFFRGVVHGGLRRVYDNGIVVPVVAALFAGAHLDVRLFPALFVVGVVLTLLRASSGSLAPSLVAHMAFNAVAVAGVMMGTVNFQPDPEPPRWYVAVAALGVTAVLVAAMITLSRRSSRAQRARQEDHG